MTGPSTRRWPGPALVLLAALCCWPPEVSAQRSSSPTSERAAIEESAPINNLIKRSRQGIERRDWKFVIDSLQRIIEDSQVVLLEKSPGLYESARRYAVGSLAELPPEGLAAYRLLNDGRAKAGLERAIAEHDAEGLRRIVDHYLLTSYGDDAAATLASWFLDEGQPAEALGLLDEIVEFCSDSDVPAGLIAARRAVALALMGQGDAAAALVAQARDEPDGPIGALLEGLVNDLTNSTALGVAGPSGQSESWPMLGGGGDRRGTMPAVTPTLVAELPWRRVLPQARVADWTDYLARRDELRLPPVFCPVVCDGRLFVKGPGGCAAIDLESFELLWEAEPEVEGIAERYLRRVSGWGPVPFEKNVASVRHDRLLHDYVAGSLSVAGDLLLSVERSSGGTYFDPDGVFVQMGGAAGLGIRGLGRTGSRDAIRIGSRLLAYDVEGGAVRWQRGLGADPSDPLYGVEFLSPPVLVDQALCVPALRDGALHLVVLDPKTGGLIHRIMLCTPPDGTVRPDEALWPADSGGMVYVPTAQGLLFAIRTADFTPLWAARYERGEAAQWRSAGAGPRYWISSPPIVCGSLVLLAPTDADRLLAFDRRTGELRWSVSRGDDRYLIAADGQNIWVAGERVSCLSAETGVRRWASEPLEATGRAILSGRLLYVPTVTGLVALGADDGQVVSRQSMPPGHPPLGNLLALPDGLISVDAHEVRKYPDLDQAYARTVAAHEADPADATAAVRYAKDPQAIHITQPPL